jgi:uncharacterized membrane protein YraQ (UPF0718 family)
MESLYYRFLNHYWGSYTRLIINESISLFNHLWIYLVMGILITTLVKLYLNKEQVAGFLYRKNHFSIVSAALIGVVSPLGSYVVIPLSAALFTTGVPLPVIMALLVSSPLIDPNLFLLTAGTFGYGLAFARLLSAFILGITAGYVTKWVIQWRKFQPENLLNRNNTIIEIAGHHSKPTIKKFLNELFRMSKFISKYFFLAILLAAAIKILTPPNLMLRAFGGNNFLSVLISTSAGIPFYVCGGAAIPVVEQLADLGMSKGAVLAFFVSGPVTKFSNLLLMNATFRWRILLIYLIVGISGAFILGLIYNLFI